MHTVERSPEPAFFAQFRSSFTRWDDLDGPSRHRIRAELANDFKNVCGYCEQPCRSTTSAHEGRDEETIDHFRPRQKFSGLWLDWMNLVYACRRCNKAKNNKWPKAGDAANLLLNRLEARYTDVSEFVNPNATGLEKLAEGLFIFHVASGEIQPEATVDDSEWSKARRTIADIDLNDSELGLYDEHHLCNRRHRQVERLNERLKSLNAFEERFSMMQEFMMPDKPFSSFVRAYILERYPMMAGYVP